jgi:SAM-dependent methyltransferase
VVDFLVSRLGLGKGHVVVDLAAGTGKLTRELVGNGARVIAVEPLSEMRAVLGRVVPSAEQVDATAEQLPFADGSIDAVTVAQAFHWFDPGPAFAEIARVLRPGGALALVWNIRELGDPLQLALDQLMRSSRGAAPSEHEQPWRASLAKQPLLGPAEERAFSWELPFTADLLVDRVASVSFVAALEPDERDALLAQVRELVDGVPEPFPFSYRTEVSVLPRVGA